jgi:hypothetical protein
MFDSVDLRYSVRDDEKPPVNAALIARAQAVMLSVGGRMLCALRRLAGDHGAALGDALRTMIMSREVAPGHWPLREAVEILARADPAQDRQVERVLRALEALISAINQLEE